MSEDIDLSALHADVQSIKNTLVNQDRVFAARAQVDDERSKKLDCRLDGFEDRLDAHGNRTTAVETQFVAFFGDQGAFRFVVDGVKDLKSNQNKILIAIAGGALTALLGIVVYLVEKHT